jgi:hypothetical protein
MNTSKVMDTMAINIFPAFDGKRWEMLAPHRVRGSLMSISPMRYQCEYFPKMSQAIHRAFRMKEKAKAYKDLPVIVEMERPPSFTKPECVPDHLIYHLEREEDALFLILQYDQS